MSVVQGNCPLPMILRYTNNKTIELNQVHPKSTRLTVQYSWFTNNAYALVEKKWSVYQDGDHALVNVRRKYLKNCYPPWLNLWNGMLG